MSARQGCQFFSETISIKYLKYLKKNRALCNKLDGNTIEPSKFPNRDEFKFDSDSAWHLQFGYIRWNHTVVGHMPGPIDTLIKYPSQIHL